MTLPYERTRAVLSVREFLVRLSSPYVDGGYKRIRREIRQEALRLLRHYPMTVDLITPAAFCLEEVHRYLDQSDMDTAAKSRTTSSR
jgi:hypothetical protein